jgi:hypothetical protein
MLVTVSEDATCKIWDNYEGSDNNDALIVQKSRETLKGH